MGFDAGKAVEPMDYDFTTVPGGKGKGTVPEPSNEAMEKFQKAFGKIQREAMALGKDIKDEDFTDEVEADLEVKAKDIGHRLDAAVAKLCKNNPTIEEMDSLPFRHKQAFAKWLLEQFSPEA